MDERAKSVGFGVYARMSGFALLALSVVAMIPRITDSYDLRQMKSGDATPIIVGTWLFGAIFVAGCAGISALAYRAASRSRAELIFESKPFGKVGEVVFALSGVFLGWFGGLLFVGVPSMLAPGSHDSVLGNMAIASMMGLPALMLLVWRPAYRVDPARRTLVRYAIASWIPFKKSLPYEFRMHARVWTILIGRTQQSVPISWAIYASLPKDKEFVTEFLPLHSSPELVEQFRQQWEERLLGALAPAPVPAPPPYLPMQRAPYAAAR